MVKFICTTQRMGMNSYHAPSGQGYVSLRGRYFDVTLPQDIEHFENKRQFKSKGFVETISDAVLPKSSNDAPDAETELKTYLTGMGGLSNKAINLLVEKFVTKDNLLFAIDDGDKLIGVGVTDNQAKAVVEYILKNEYEEVEEESESEDAPEETDPEEKSLDDEVEDEPTESDSQEEGK